jgi:hypothetical protein
MISARTTVDCLGEGIVVAVAEAAHGRLDAGLGQALGGLDRQVMCPLAEPDRRRCCRWLEPPVELRPDEIRARLPEDLVRLAKLAVWRSRFLTRPRLTEVSPALPLGALGLTYPQAQRLPIAAGLLGDRADRRLRGGLGFLLCYQADRALARLRRV